MHSAVIKSGCPDDFEGCVFAEVLDFDNVLSRVKIKTEYDRDSKEVVSEIQCADLKDLLGTVSDLIRTQILVEKMMDLFRKD